jgi:VWFA-related protein
MHSMKLVVLGACAGAVFLAGARPEGRGGPQQPQSQPQNDAQSFRFRTGVELINVTATVTDESGRFVSGLKQDDFRVYQDDARQSITHFNSERVPVSLGIVLDTSGSMDGEKMRAAREALDRFLYQLLDPSDEVFLYRFDSTPVLVEGWTTDRRRITDELARIQPRGGTALFDAVAEAVPLAQGGTHRKKAVLVISDGNDTSSRIDVTSLKQLIRETEVLVYAIGIDSQSTYQGDSPIWQSPLAQIASAMQRKPRTPIPLPFPIPGGRRPAPPPTVPPPSKPNYPQPQPRSIGRDNDRVNVAALRDITDNSGGRTEIIRGARDLDPATAGIADELSKQYYLGYASTGVKDGRWHTIRVEVSNPNYHVRARRGFVATP